ncbi:MAG: hypothetical protein AAB336_03040 [Acidobacteriota bacterium]
MWSMKEEDNELTIRGFPVIMWSIAFLALAGGAYFHLLYLPTFAELLKESISTILTISFALLFLPIVGLSLIYFFPLVITKINRREKSVKIEKLGILGKRVNLHRFDALNGGFRVKSEEDEDNKESLKLYFDLKSGKRIFLSSDWTEFGKGKAYDVAMKANEYLRPQNP